MKLFFFVLLVLCAPFTVVVHAGVEQVTIAVILERTGPDSSGNRATIDGIRFAVDELNQQGGLLGKQVKLLELDNRSTALYSKKVAQKAVQANVIAVFGANWSSNSLAMAPVFQSAKIPMISPFSTNPAVTLVGDYIFRICFIDSFQGIAMAKFAAQDLKAKTAAILINANSRYSEGLADFFSRSFVDNGGKIVLAMDYLQNAEDFHEQLEAVKKVEPDIIFLPGHNADSAQIIKQAREGGLLTPFLGGDGWGIAMYGHAGSALQGNYYSGHWHKDNANTRSRQFVAEYENKNGTIKESDQALAYDMVFLFADAVRRADSLEPWKIRNALAATRDYPGVTGNITFNANGDPIKPVVILQFDKGSSRYVKTMRP